MIYHVAARVDHKTRRPHFVFFIVSANMFEGHSKSLPSHNHGFLLEGGSSNHQGGHEFSV